MRPLGEGQRLLILVDQFEELFRYPPETASRFQAEAEVAAFIALLLATARHPDCYLVITLRSEFLGSCSPYSGLAEAINAGLFLTPALSPEQLADAIELPARLPGFDGEVEPELVRELLAQASGIQDPLPLLQHALLRLWDQGGSGPVEPSESAPRRGDSSTPAPGPDSIRRAPTHRLTLEDLNTLGGLQQALDDHAEQAWIELDGRAQDCPQHHIIETLFRALTERSPSGQDVRRPVSVQTVAELAGVSPEAVIAAAEPFRRAGRSFLLPSAGQDLGPEASLDISHEALIRQWRRLHEWAADEAPQAELYRRLEGAAQRHGNKEGALWIDPDLQLALDWRNKHRPSELWARRYGGDFGRATAFLNASREAREQQQAEKEHRRRHELRLAWGIAVGALVALGLMGWLAHWALTSGYSPPAVSIIPPSSGAWTPARP